MPQKREMIQIMADKGTTMTRDHPGPGICCAHLEEGLAIHQFDNVFQSDGYDNIFRVQNLKGGSGWGVWLFTFAGT